MPQKNLRTIQNNLCHIVYSIKRSMEKQLVVGSDNEVSKILNFFTYHLKIQMNLKYIM